MNHEATFETRRLDDTCGEPGCDSRPTRVGLGVIWEKREIALYAWCEEHATDAMGRARAMKADEEGLQ